MNPSPDRRTYEVSAREYQASLPLEHYAETVPSGAQPAVTLSSFPVVRIDRPDVHCFNELLIQYPGAGEPHGIGKVVPDNLIVLHDGKLEPGLSFNTPFESGRVFLAIGYVPRGTERKDYQDHVTRYERDLAMPYHLQYEPRSDRIALVRRAPDGAFVRVEPNRHGRLPIPELELEVGLIDKAMRYWFRGQLVRTPAEMMQEMAAIRARLAAVVEEQSLEQLEAEVARMKAELDRLRGR